MTRALLFALALCPAALGGEPALMRYKLEPGQQIRYTSSSSLKYGDKGRGGEHRSRDEWTIWVLKANADGSARVLARDVNTFTQSFNGGEPNKAEPTTTFVAADIFPDGRIPPQASFAYRGSPSPLFPRLPATAAELASGWAAEDAGGSTAATPAGPNRFAVTRVGPLDKVYLTTRKSTYAFDPTRGLVSRVETEVTQGYGFEGKTTGTTELVGVTTVPAPELAKLAADAETYFAATAAYDAATEGAMKLAPDLAQATLDKAKAALELAAKGVTQPDLKAQLDAQIQSSRADGQVHARRLGPPRQGRRQAGVRRRGDHARRQAGVARRLQGQSGGARLLVPRLRLVHPGDAADEPTRRRLQK